MRSRSKHITKSISSNTIINARDKDIWDNITNVQIEKFSHPFVFRLLNIPKPISAEVLSEGVGGRRIAYFNNTEKRFVQKILTWKPFIEYSFSFNPEKGFRVGYLFELSEGVFRILTGTYILERAGKTTRLKLQTIYSIDYRLYYLFQPTRKVYSENISTILIEIHQKER